MKIYKPQKSLGVMPETDIICRPWPAIFTRDIDQVMKRVQLWQNANTDWSLPYSCIWIFNYK